ncbi:expressed unknown protein [Seminavis robusta]|uniref:EGF-like domain-containing protein n=1 Tax=Seminavis robusta TaxID=568900 RepID=A0A9N8DT77_9STRA|nr:expressed unknown protein [Seminavis robusta]|eukprot:Sro338_g120820.1 n/a (1429) ;mRNA; r:27600-32120
MTQRSSEDKVHATASMRGSTAFFDIENACCSDDTTSENSATTPSPNQQQQKAKAKAQSSLIETLSPKDLEHLALLLQPVMMKHASQQHQEEEEPEIDLSDMSQRFQPFQAMKDDEEEEPEIDLSKPSQVEESALYSWQEEDEDEPEKDNQQVVQRQLNPQRRRRKRQGGRQALQDDPEWHSPFGESTYSLLYLSGFNSRGFWYAFLVYATQITVISLTLIDVVDWTSPTNKLNLPPNVNMSVTIAQGIALFQAVAFQFDLLEVVSKLKDGFHPEVQETYPGATYLSWLLSCTAQLIAGLLLLVCIFILIMPVDNVLDIMLNFAALDFMADIDDVAFYIAKAGFVGRELQRAANKAAEFKVRKRTIAAQGWLQRFWKPLLFHMLIGALLAGWVTIIGFRFSGKYVCNTIMVNMGDDFVPSMGPFNGMYDLQLVGGGLERRAQYVERRAVEIDSPRRGIFGYCDDIKAWTFRVGYKDDDDSSDDACQWVARSAETDTFDFLNTAASQWFVRDSTQREVVLEPFSLFCFDCQEEDVENSDDCGRKGTCSNAVCQCEDGWYGLRCEFVSPCSWITIDARTEDFASTRDWSDEFQSIELGSGALVEAYYRPVYVYEYDTGDYDVVMFTGGRWALTSSEFLPHGGRIPDKLLGDGQESVGSDIGNFFKHHFHGYKGYSANYSVAFLSDYVELGTHLDSSAPIGFTWYFAEEAKEASNRNQGTSKEVDTVFLCQVCNDNSSSIESNPCLYDGICVDGKCECSLDSTGSLCEVPPVRNGHCDPNFNTPEFKMDGGDCCESTCESTSQYVCGAEKDGYVSTGYFYCDLPKDEWQSHPIEGDAGSYAGFALGISMGSMAVSELLQDRVRIYDQVGSSWVLRDTILGAPNSRFGLRVAISSGPFNVVGNPSFKAPLTVATTDTFRTLRIYKCDMDGCELTQEFSTILVHDFTLSYDGTVLAASLLTSNQAPTMIRVFESKQGLFEFRTDVTNVRQNFTTSLLSMSLSGDGSTLAVQNQLAGVDPATNMPVVIDEHVSVMFWNEFARAYDVEDEFRLESNFNTIIYSLSVRLSQDGSVLAFGFPRCVDARLRVRVRNDDNKWSDQRAPLIVVESNQCTDSERPHRNNALALSSDGSKIAFRVGTKVKVFEWDFGSEDWSEVGDEFPFLHYPVSMSSDGSTLAIGAPEDGIGGVTSIYSVAGRKLCPSDMSLLRVSITIDRFPGDVLWNLANNNTGEILFEQEAYPPEYAYATILEETCVPADSCFVFSIRNRKGRGLQAPGQYALLMDGETVVNGTFEGLFAREYFGNCPSCPAGTLPFSMMMMSCEPIPWHLLEVTSVGNTSTTGSELAPPSSCNEDWNGENCTQWVSYETCLDPVCYIFQVLSHRQAHVEVSLWNVTRRPLPSAVCFGEPQFVGDLWKCNNVGREVVHSSGLVDIPFP